jgi:hypothetical protein
MSTRRCCIWKLCWAVVCLLVVGLPRIHAATPPHPRLILTPARIAALKSEIATTRREFWPNALASADEFSRETVPEMRDANNRYRRFGDTMPALGLAFRMTGDRRYVDAAERWLEAMLAVPEWRGSQNLGRSSWVTGAAFLYDWLHDALPADTRARVRERLVKEGEILLRETSYWRLLSNHCLIETAALGLIGLTLDGEHERAAAFLGTAHERTELIIEHAPRDGSWGEGIQYWQYGLGYFLRFLEAAKTAGQRDYFPRYSWLTQTGFFPVSLFGSRRSSRDGQHRRQRDERLRGQLSVISAGLGLPKRLFPGLRQQNPLHQLLQVQLAGFHRL